MVYHKKMFFYFSSVLILFPLLLLLFHGSSAFIEFNSIQFKKLCTMHYSMYVCMIMGMKKKIILIIPNIN